MSNKIHVLVAIPKLTAGGAERVLSFVANNLNREKFEVTLLIIGSKKENKYDVSKTNTIYLNKSRVRHAVFSIIKTIKKIKPNIVLSTISDLNVVMGYISLLFPSIKFIGRHTFIISGTNATTKLNKKFNYRIYGLKKLDYFICQSYDMKQSIINHYNLDSKRLKIINNPVTNLNFIKETNKERTIKKYITVGRLSKLKGHIRLLNILKEVNHNFVFTIIGYGEFKHEIFDEIKKLGLTRNVRHIEYTDNVYKYLIENDIFLQGSYSEGFPNALLESCAVGVPAIAFDVPGGTKEIITNGINGYLVNNESEFLEKLNEKKAWNPNDVKECVTKKFSPSIIMKDYENFFLNVVSQ